MTDNIQKQITRNVSVNRNRTPQEALDACGRVQFVGAAVASAMPQGIDERVTLVYFEPDPSAYRDGWLSSEALEAEYKKRNLVPDPQAQIDDNAANPEFADTTPNACQWADKDGHWCCATFARRFSQRSVGVHLFGNTWSAGWLFGGVEQKS